MLPGVLNSPPEAQDALQSFSPSECLLISKIQMLLIPPGKLVMEPPEPKLHHSHTFLTSYHINLLSAHLVPALKGGLLSLIALGTGTRHTWVNACWTRERELARDAPLQVGLQWRKGPIADRTVTEEEMSLASPLPCACLHTGPLPNQKPFPHRILHRSVGRPTRRNQLQWSFLMS